MILYAIRNAVVTVESVKKETNCGWREHNNGFINRKVLSKFVNLDTTYYTADLDEAMLWSSKISSHIHSLLQVSKASITDIEFWEENGSEECDVPESRYAEVYRED